MKVPLALLRTGGVPFLFGFFAGEQLSEQDDFVVLESHFDYWVNEHLLLVAEFGEESVVIASEGLPGRQVEVGVVVEDFIDLFERLILEVFLVKYVIPSS